MSNADPVTPCSPSGSGAFTDNCWVKELVLRGTSTPEDEVTKYVIEVYTPDRGAGGTDKQPLLQWDNDIGHQYHKVKYSGSGENTFERKSLGFGTISSRYPLQHARLQVSLTNDGGGDNPTWRLGGVGLTWEIGDGVYESACFWFNRDLQPGGPSVDTLANTGCDFDEQIRIFLLREIDLESTDVKVVL